MNDRYPECNLEREIDLPRLASALAKKRWLISLVSVLGAAIMLVGTLVLVPPQYESAAMFYVNNGTPAAGDASGSISSGDLVTSRSLVDSYIVILETRESLQNVIDYAGVNLTYDRLKKMITASAVNDTEFFQVVVTGSDPHEAEKLANAIAYVLPQRISGILGGTSAKVVDTAVAAASPSAPNYFRNTLLGFVMGLAAAVGSVLLREIFDTTIRTEEDIRLVCPHPILTAVPDMEVQANGRDCGTRKREKHGSATPARIGREIPFGASEAYKLLRIKLLFSFADEQNCRIIGISSGLVGEGKSLSAVNLAHSLSQLKKKVLLLDCDMRRPSVSGKLPIKKMPGLSDFLAGQCKADSLIQPCGLPGEEQAFGVIASGRIPPNPVELLSSARMARFLKFLRQHYDYILLDLPPVGEVGDALAVAKEIDGFLLVVRRNYCSRTALQAAVQQFGFVDARVLGLVFNCTAEDGGAYGRNDHLQYGQMDCGNAQGRFLQKQKTVGEKRSTETRKRYR